MEMKKQHLNTTKLEGMMIQHNFIEAHTTTGKIPCELAEMDLQLGYNRWLG